MYRGLNGSDHSLYLHPYQILCSWQELGEAIVKCNVQEQSIHHWDPVAG